MGRPAALPPRVSPPDGPGLWAVYRLRVTNHDDVDRQELIPVFVDRDGRSHPRLARALLDLAPGQVEPAFVPADGLDLLALNGTPAPGVDGDSLWGLTFSTMNRPRFVCHSAGHIGVFAWLFDIDGNMTGSSGIWAGQE